MHVILLLYQWLRTETDPFPPLTPVEVEGAEIIAGKNSDARIKPLPLANGHGRYITVTPERALVSVGEWPLHIAVKFLTVSLPKPPYGGFRSETAIWIRKWLKMSVETSRKPQLE